MHFLQTVNEQTERLDKLVRDLLALTRIESQERRPALHPVRLAEIVDLCVNRHISNAERKEMRLVTVPPADPVQVVADEESLEQILDNLIDNAIKYTNSGGTITVRWETEEPRCRIDVEDTGIGIPAGAPVTDLRTLLPGRSGAVARAGWHGAGAVDRQAPGPDLGGTVSVSSRLGKGPRSQSN